MEDDKREEDFHDFFVDKINLKNGKIGLVPIDVKLLKSLKFPDYLETTQYDSSSHVRMPVINNSLDAFDVTKPLRGNSFSIIYNLLKNPLVELFSTISPSFESLKGFFIIIIIIIGRYYG